MRNTPYGYKIENGRAVIDRSEADKLRRLYANYLSGMSLTGAAAEAGIEVCHCSAKRLLENRRYLGDSFYPALIDRETYEAAGAERLRRAQRLGRLNRESSPARTSVPTRFRLAPAKEHYDDPKQQAEYLYSLIESEEI